jgi:hypothetical protein
MIFTILNVSHEFYEGNRLKPFALCIVLLPRCGKVPSQVQLDTVSAVQIFRNVIGTLPDDCSS